MRKVWISVDDETARRLEMLTGPRTGNKGVVVREAVRRMAEQEGFERYLDWLEQQPEVRIRLEQGLRDQKKGRTVSHTEALRPLRKPR